MTVSPPRAQVVSPPRAHFLIFPEPHAVSHQKPWYWSRRRLLCEPHLSNYHVSPLRLASALLLLQRLQQILSGGMLAATTNVRHCPHLRVRGSADNCFTAPRARSVVGINLNNAGFLEQGKTNPVLTVKSSAITRTRNTCAVICGSTKIKSANKSA